MKAKSYKYIDTIKDRYSKCNQSKNFMPDNEKVTLTGPSSIYGFLIHSCFVDDGQGNKFELVDDKGCSTDTYLLPQIQYDDSKLSAFTTAQVFKYADKVQLYFTCTVQLCYKHDGGCEGVMPPSCSTDSLSVGEPYQGSNLELDKDDDDNDSHEDKQFFGPMHSSDYGRSKYRDSPLNETDMGEHFLVQLYFTCTVQLCYKHDGGCEGVMPPSCSTDSLSKYRDSPLNETDMGEHFLVFSNHSTAYPGITPVLSFLSEVEK
ncbi:unnamed protein product [Strongylus vulgaris]|uniref:ZP domain-containing protein n=1 Tax=Strongylus vulgaris TaxID=40348 RepID=A0A3P7JIQ7_STRVU|nr:unnamed protein product [Strongylus vulgaris]